MTIRKSLPGGGALLASAETAITGVDGLAGAGNGLEWGVIAEGETLHLHLAAGAVLPPGIAAASRAWDLAASLVGPLDVSLAVASGPAFDAAGAVTPLGGAAAAEAAAFAALPVPVLDEGAEAIWDRLAHGARRAQALIREKRLVAAVLAFRGRGRLVGPVAGDLLMRFGVSAWR